MSQRQQGTVMNGQQPSHPTDAVSGLSALCFGLSEVFLQFGRGLRV